MRLGRHPIGGSLYEGDRVKRRLVVVVDADTFDVDAPMGGVGQADLLAALLQHEHEIELYRYSDRGAPPDAEVMELEWTSRAAAIGWLVVEPDPPGLTSHRLTSSNGSQLTDRAIIAGNVEHATAALKEAGGDPLAWKSDALALVSAREMEADLLITARASLLNSRTALSGGLTVASPLDALPLVGLYLRARGHYLEAKSRNITFRTTKLEFFHTAACIGIPRANDVIVRSEMLDLARGRGDCGALAASSIRRVARALERRDIIWRLINQPQNLEIAEDTLAAFDSFLFFLMGAFDGAARLAHLATGVVGPMTQVAWQKEQWRKALHAESPSLANLFTGNSREAATLHVLRSLRNTIHAQGLAALSVNDGSRHSWTGIELNQHDAGKVTAWAASIVPLEAWGLQRISEDRLLADPSHMMDRLLVESLSALALVFQEIDSVIAPQIAPLQRSEKSVFNQELVDEHLFLQLGLPS